VSKYSTWEVEEQEVEEAGDYATWEVALVEATE